MLKDRQKDEIYVLMTKLRCNTEVIGNIMKDIESDAGHISEDDFDFISFSKKCNFAKEIINDVMEMVMEHRSNINRLEQIANDTSSANSNESLIENDNSFIKTFISETPDKVYTCIHNIKTGEKKFYMYDKINIKTYQIQEKDYNDMLLKSNEEYNIKINNNNN